MIVAIVGSRDFPDLARVARYVQGIAAKHPEAVIVSGGARGVDSAAERAARAANLEVLSYRQYQFDHMSGSKEYAIDRVIEGERAKEVAAAHFSKHQSRSFRSFGQAAFFRNGLIVGAADVVVAFTTGSRGTADSISKARALGKPVFVYQP